MEAALNPQELPLPVLARAAEIQREMQQSIYSRTDHLFAGLLLFEWITSIAAVLWLSPWSWAGRYSQFHIHGWAAIFLGGVIVSFPVALAIWHPGRPLTRYTIATSQMLMSGLLIHLTGGRIETHFHIFGSLAFLAFYRDWRVLIPATIVVTFDHFLRGVYWPESIFGLAVVSHWRWVEHAGWVVFEDIFLIYSCLQAVEITRKMALQRAALEESYRSVEAKVRERTIALTGSEESLRAARDLAEGANRAKSTFLAAMSHEIRTPMNGILGLTQVVLDSQLSAEQRENLQLVKFSAESLLTIVGDVLDFSKIEAGKFDLEAIPFNVRECVTASVRTLEIRAREKHLLLSALVLPDVPLFVVGDSLRIRQILLNLIGNALKFTEQGGIHVAVSLQFQESARIELRFSVTDTGPGIPEDRQQKIFSAFTQADESTSRRYGGTGLGLAISSRLTTLMGGRIEVSSELGKGSTFSFTAVFAPVPDVDSSAFALARPSLRSLPEPAIDTPLRILVAEDNLVNQTLARRLLEKRGHTVVIVGNGIEAVRQAKEHCFDVILMDVQMPEMDGCDAARAIRILESGRGLHVPIIALTAHALKDDKDKCLAAGMDGYVTKPIRPAELFDVLLQVTAKTAKSQ
jgi:two-component system, sensor histidine kinase and response regulator